MNIIVRLMLVALLIVIAVPAYSGEAVQMWKCEMDDDTTEAQVETMAKEWLTAAKKVPGGENFKGYVYFPVAVNATGETDVMFVVVAPSFEAWGKFWDNYAGSEAAKLEDQQGEWIACPDSVVWEAYEVK